MDKNSTEAPQDQGEGTGTEGEGTNLDYLDTIPSWRAFHLQRHHEDYHNKLMMITHEVRHIKDQGEGTGALPTERHEMSAADQGEETGPLHTEGPEMSEITAITPTELSTAYKSETSSVTDTPKAHLDTLPGWRAFHLQRHHRDYHNELMSITYEARHRMLESQVRLAGDGVLAAVGPERKEQVAGCTTDKKQVSAYATTLQQLKNGVKVPPTGWKCCKCDETENLWLNLTDGSILCGRRNWDGTGGNDHALEHYQETNYPLAVNLGTIPPDSQGADVYSYPEDDTVEDPLLAEHLAHFGIDFSLLRKTERTTAERELDQNTDFDRDKIPENGKELEPLFGPGLPTLVTGLTLVSGRCCHLASVMQAVFSTKDFSLYYSENVKLDDAFKQAPGDPTLDLDIQQ